MSNSRCSENNFADLKPTPLASRKLLPLVSGSLAFDRAAWLAADRQGEDNARHTILSAV
jgi:hypothetical protein